jgi:hypothetical protein
MKVLGNEVDKWSIIIISISISINLELIFNLTKPVPSILM